MRKRFFASTFFQTVVLLALMFLAPPPSLRAEQKEPALPKDLPSYGPMKPASAPRVEVERLPNGLTMWLAPRSGFPKVAFAVAVRGGLAADPKERPGLAELIVRAVDQGTKTHTAKQIAEEIQAAGGDLKGESLADNIVVSTQVLASRAEAGLAVLADIMQNATFPEQEVELAKRNAGDELEANEARPEFLARRALAKAVFGDHLYGVVSPTKDSISRTTAEELRGEYARRFCPDQALLVAIGDFEPQTLKQVVIKLFGAWAAASQPAMVKLDAPAQNNSHSIYFVDRPGSVQTTFRMAAYSPTERDPDYAAATVGNAIYGGMFGSRLIRNIREDKGYTYSPWGIISARREAALLETHADVRNAVTGATFNEINYELNRMATTTPSPDEITRAKRYLVGLEGFLLQSQATIASELAAIWARGLPPEELGLRTEKIQKVTEKDLQAAAEKYFPAARQTIVAVGQQKVIQEQLAPFQLDLKPAPWTF